MEFIINNLCVLLLSGNRAILFYACKVSNELTQVGMHPCVRFWKAKLADTQRHAAEIVRQCPSPELRQTWPGILVHPLINCVMSSKLLCLSESLR